MAGDRGVRLGELVQAFATEGAGPREIVDDLARQIGIVLASLDGTETEAFLIAEGCSDKILTQFLLLRGHQAARGLIGAQQ